MRYHHPLDLIRSFKNLDDLGISHHPLNRMIFGKTLPL
jgi:hypothetical protein